LLSPNRLLCRKLIAIFMTRKLLLSATLVLFALPMAFAQMPAPTSVTTPVVDAPRPLKIGGNILPPVLISSVEPKFKRPLFHKAKGGIVLVGLTVPIDGIPTDVHIVRSGGQTFDKSAMNAVRQYRFRPATEQGKPVPVIMNVEVHYQVF
jgi:TonB family protein